MTETGYAALVGIGLVIGFGSGRVFSTFVFIKRLFKAGFDSSEVVRIMKGKKAQDVEL